MLKNYIWTLALVVSATTLIVLVSALIWAKVWVKKLGVEIPIDKKIEGVNRKQLYYSTTSPGILTEFFRRIIGKFDKEYWVENCGTDAYLYLMLQRRLLALVALIALLTLFTSFTFNFLFVDLKHSNSLFEQSTLDNHYLPAWVQVCLVTVLTGAVLLMVSQMRSEAQQLFEEQQQEKCKE